MTIGITGSTGQLGRGVIEGLKQRGAGSSVVALARTPDKAADLGVAVRGFDYEQTAALPAALEGIKTLLLISSNELGRRSAQHRNVIAAAKQAGVRRIVYTSVLRAATSTLSVAIEHRETEGFLRESGLPFTLLRNGWYTENHTGSLHGAVAAGALIGSAGSGRISGAARADYAEAAAVVLSSEGHEGKTYELAGDSAYTLSDLAAEVSRQTGKNIAYNDLPEAAYAAALLQFGLPEVFANAIASWDVEATKGELFDEGRQLSKLIGRPTTPLSATVTAALG